ncbi:MAG: DUF4834 family protein [Rikenellaceae bacterium]
MFDYIKRNPLIFILIFLAVVAPRLVFSAIGIIIYAILGVVILLMALGLYFKARMNRIRKEMNNQAGGDSRSYTYTWSSRGESKKSQEPKSGVKIVADESSQEKKVSKNVGEYVDFEEIEE